jgi:hypothetical protein
MQTFSEYLTEINAAVKKGDFVIPNNPTELKTLCVKMGWTNTRYESIRKGLFPTISENEALSAKFMKMM